MTSATRNATVFCLFLLVLLGAAFVARHALLLIYSSVIFAVVFNPVVDRLCHFSIGKWRPSRGMAVCLIAVCVAICIALVSFFIVPPLVQQVRTFSGQMPGLLNRLQERLGRTAGVTWGASPLSNYLTQHVQVIGTVFGTVAGTIGSLGTVVLLTAYLTVNGAETYRWSISLFPEGQQAKLRKTLDGAGKRMRHWLAGQFLLMAILGTASTITFGFLRIHSFLLLGLFAGLANFVPFLGPIATIILAGSVAGADSWWKLAGGLGFYAVYQQVESAFLTPKIMQVQVHLSPVAVIIALLLGAEIAGIGGAILAVPSAVVAAAFIGSYVANTPETAARTD
jgi:predicted PurR-regulated permease PerM